MKDDFIRSVTPVILTFDEAPNIGRTLAKLTSFREVVVVDSGSTDGTLALVARFPNARVVHRTFDRHADQWNFAIHECGLASEWALALDADYLLTDDFLEELGTLSPPPDVHGYWVSFRYCVFGRRLSSSLYPPVLALFRHRRAHYLQDGHTQRAQVDGPTGAIRSPILHDDRKSLARWLHSQRTYAEQEAALLMNPGGRRLGLADRLRRLHVVMPWLAPAYCLTVGRGLLDGWPGVYYALQRAVAEAILALFLLEARLSSRASADGR